MTAAASPAPAGTGVQLLPSDRFFIRTVSLAPGADTATQVALAWESLAPFPPAQLYHGWLKEARGDRALVFAAFRKRFSADEAAAWPEAAAVLPDFLAMVGRPPDRALIRLLSGPTGLVALAWDGAGELPALVLARETEPSTAETQQAALLTELRERTGLADAPVQIFAGTVVSRGPNSRGEIALELARPGEPWTTVLGPKVVESADVRDKEFLGTLRVGRKRDLFLWRGFAACLGGLAALMLIEAGLFFAGIWLQDAKGALAQQAPAVQRIETAQALSARIEEMTQRRLMPFEMLAVVNRDRPASVQFVRATTSGLYILEIEAQTGNAADVGGYEAVLRAHPGLAAVETRDLRSRDGQTTFILSVTFKPETLQREGGS